MPSPLRLHKWFALVVVISFPLRGSNVAADPIPGSEDSVTVHMVGTLRTGVVAIGGETTGTTITVKGITWELQFNEQQQVEAQALAGKQVAVSGRLTRKAGTEFPDRWIVDVDSLALATPLYSNLKRVRVVCRDHSAGVTVQSGPYRSDGAFINIKSKTGIGSVTIKGANDKWPKHILVHLQLRGLESFKVTSGGTVIEWSLSSTGNNPLHVTLHQNKQTSEISTDNPYFAGLRINGPIGDGNLIPLQDGYFSLTLPAKLFEGNPAEIRLSWVDFYRN